MDIGNSESVGKALEQVAAKFDRIDLHINNAVTTSPDVEKDFFHVGHRFITNEGKDYPF